MITTTDFGTLCDGRTVRLYTLKNNAIELSVTDYGSTLVRLLVPDKNGKPTDVVLGYDDLAGYVADDTCFGNNVGRSANRIGGASFTLNGTEYKLAANDGENNLHSGPDSYSKRIWNVAAKTDTSITFSLESPHMDQGFPGALTMSVTYEISDRNEEPAFSITYEAAPDQDTLISMTHHSYYNLNGEGSGDILNHKVTLAADFYTPTDAASVPTGEITSVTGTVMDFRDGRYLGTDIEDSTLQTARGYDHNWVIGTGYGVPHKVLTATGDQSGISMDLSTNYPGIQLYTANYLAHVAGKQGHVYEARDAVCFEPQYFPDAIHHPNFPSPVVKAGETYKKQIIYHFYTD